MQANRAAAPQESIKYQRIPVIQHIQGSNKYILLDSLSTHDPQERIDRYVSGIQVLHVILIEEAKVTLYRLHR